MTGLAAADAPVVAGWWQEFCARGVLPAGLELVQGRLIRAVHRGVLPSGAVFMKTMGFPRWRDRLRYLLRALPASHEARLLRAAAAAGVPVPEVVAVRTARRWLVPHRSMLVLRALPAASAPGAPSLAVAAALGARLLRAGIEPLDLHAGNFVALADGSFAVLDLQSARRWPWTARCARARVQVAARLLREPWPHGAQGVEPLLTGGLVQNREEGQRAAAQARRAARRWWRSRLLRCMTTSSEFVRRWHWWGREHIVRGAGALRWLPAEPHALHAWLGARALAVCEGQPLPLRGLRRAWWSWRGRGWLAFDTECGEAECRSAVATALGGYERHRAAIEGLGHGG